MRYKKPISKTPKDKSKLAEISPSDWLMYGGIALITISLASWIWQVAGIFLGLNCIYFAFQSEIWSKVNERNRPKDS